MIIKRLFLLPSIFLATMMLASCGARVTLGDREGKLVDEHKFSPGQFHTIPMPESLPSTANGKLMYEKMNCAQCHGQDGSGANLSAPGLLNDASKASGDRSPKFQFGILYFGIPGWFHPTLKGVLTTSEVWDLVFYVRTFAVPPLSDAQLVRAKEIFSSDCADCHGEKGYGDGVLSHNLNPLPANFHESGRFLDREDEMLVSHIGKGLYPTAMPSFAGRKDRTLNVDFDDRTIRMMVQYVRHFEMTKELTKQEGNSGSSPSGGK